MILRSAWKAGTTSPSKACKRRVKRGFRVTTNTTLFDGADPKSVRAFFDEMMDLGVEGMMLSPGYSYDKAPDQQHFLGRARTRRLFRAILSNRKPQWRFNQSPLFLEFLMGKRIRCTPWGMPTYNIFGWQKPCYLLQDGYADTFAGTAGDDRVGKAMARNPATPNAPTAWCTADMKHLGGPHVRIAERLLATVKATLQPLQRSLRAAVCWMKKRARPRLQSAGADPNEVAEETRV